MSDIELISQFEFDEHRHVFVAEDGQPIVRLKFSEIEKVRDAIVCWAAVWYVFGVEGETDPIVEYQKVNLANKTGSNGWNKISSAIQGIDPRDWESLTQKAISASLSHWFAAAVSSENITTDFDLDDIDSPFLIEPLVSSSGLTMLFSPPGAGKSLIAMGLCVSLATGYPIFGATPTKVGSVLYVDFEDSVLTHKVRVKAMLKAIGLDSSDMKGVIHHFKVTGDLKQHISRIRNKARELDVVLIVVDSMGRARRGDASDGDATIKLTDAMDSFGYPVLALDHTTKAVNEQVEKGTMVDPSSVTGIGSIFSTASARLGWFIHKLNTSKPMSRKYNLYNNKYNIVAEQAPRSLTIDLENDHRGLLTSVGFKMWDSVTFEEMRVETSEVSIARWMVREDKVSTTTKEAQDATGLSQTAANKALQKKEWYEKLPKQGKHQPYRLTEAGMNLLSTLEGTQ